MKKTIFGIGILLLIQNGAFASTDINFHGTVHETPECTINNGQPITVDFGTVDIDTIDGVQHSIQIDYAMTCESLPEDISKWFYAFTLSGAQSSFSSSALATNIENLGIELKADDSPVSIGASPALSTSNIGKPLPVLTATLVKNSGTTLATGDFSATGSLSVSYY